MSFLSLLLDLKNIYSILKIIDSVFLDKTAQMLNAIAKNELKSALRTIDDARLSNDKYRELSSAITQMRLSMEKFSECNIKKCKVAVLIAFYYKVIGEEELSKVFAKRSIDYFDSYLNNACGNVYAFGKYHQKSILINVLKSDLDDMGIKHNVKSKDSEASFFDSFWNGSGYLNEETKLIKEKSMIYFKNFANSISL